MRLRQWQAIDSTGSFAAAQLAVPWPINPVCRGLLYDLTRSDAAIQEARRESTWRYAKQSVASSRTT
jgi:hypothetical protein